MRLKAALAIALVAGLAASAQAVPVGAGIAPELESERGGAGVAYARCTTIVAACAATAAGAGNTCISANGGILGFEGYAEVCASWATAATASVALTVVTATVAGESTVSFQPDPERNDPVTFCTPEPPVRCVTYYPPDGEPAAPESKQKPCQDQLTPFDVGWGIGTSVSCATSAGGFTGDGCWSAEAVATASNELGEATPPPASATGCGPADESEWRAAFELAGSFGSMVEPLLTTECCGDRAESVPIGELPEPGQRFVIEMVTNDAMRIFEDATAGWPNSWEYDLLRYSILTSVADAFESNEGMEVQVIREA